ncbi:MAG: AAA family ATPase [Rickettsiales bacterium]|nr:AAA family ATPase [Rickettsiales bacterium]
MATTIVIGNEKGGAGKTTVAVHLTMALLYLGFEVASVDTDIRQASFTNYLENRKATTKFKNFDIPNPKHYRIKSDKQQTTAEISNNEHDQITTILSQENEVQDFIIIDTPGTHNSLSRLVHSFADIVITPINDSFFDINVLAEVKAENLDVVKPGIYSQMIWEQKINKAKRDGKSMDWIIMRNRLHSLDSNNKKNIEKVISKLSKKVGCKIASGFGERVIFKELFLKGLTLLDLKNKAITTNMTVSHLAARHELFNLLKTIDNKKINAVLAESLL